MQKSKVTEMFSSFTPEELKEFEKLVASPYFSREETSRQYSRP